MPDDDSSSEEISRRNGGLFSKLGNLFSGSNRATQDVETINESSSTTPSPSEMRLRVAEFETATVSDVMIPRVEIKAVEVETTVEELLKIFTEESHSRLPVYREALDDPIGLVHIKDFVAELASGDGVDSMSNEKLLAKIKREILFVPASMRLPDLLVKMQTSRIHLALVVDEYGGTDGLVSLEDLVEQIVGDIEDEHDEEEAHFEQRAPGVWEADARAEIEDFEEESELSLALADYEDEIDTLGGLVFALAGRVPHRGEIVQHPSNVAFEVIEADSRRIKKLRVRCGATHSPATTAGIKESAKAVS
ncbi:transporter associated domain-containing protein [Hirschia baltica]|uniref:CBS domain containing protein n=1 Tax=Hirschia baltica (strain ATCC 49814 / DSM 5838 / IFAM 1418) TaxID=582402 RepID=C6XIE5_HIRBI|nr:transporter associated domain-containing protein [Hirschia baltica]ACT60752.1 CBS domain containing protein [Hirschia baltica ATCC 49814]